VADARIAGEAGAGGGTDSGGALRRCVLEHHPLRLFWARLGGAWRELRRLQPHPPAVDALLGEAVTASVLLAATLKFQGTLSLQLQGNGLVRLLVAQCTHDFCVRGVARLREGAALAGAAAGASGDAAMDFSALVGNGRLTVSIEAEERAARYQGIVALEGDSLGACLTSYFASSEQLPTRIALSADAVHGAGVLLQKMPEAASYGEARGARSQQVWDDVERNLTALGPALLHAREAEPLLQRVCGKHDGRVFSPTAVRFACRCSQPRVAALLRALGEEEVRDILAEQGAVTVTCEFCGRPYRFDAIDVARLFGDAAGPAPPPSVN
jgi:molecular chaperone Hsp33